MYAVLFPLSNYMPFSGLTFLEPPAGRMLRCPQFLLICLAPTGVILCLSLSLLLNHGHCTGQGPCYYVTMHPASACVSMPVEGAWQNPDYILCFLTSVLCYFFIIIGGVGLSPLGTAATSGLLYKPQMIDEDDCGSTGGIKIGRGNRSTRRKPAPAPFCPPHIPHDQTGARTPGRRGGKPATNRLNHGAAPVLCY
jgi:hypothetical protein